MSTSQELLSAVREWRPEAVSAFEALLPEFVDADVLLPACVDFRGCLLNRTATIDNPHLEEWFEDRFVDTQREYVLNHLHLWDAVWLPTDQAVSDARTAQLRAFLPVLANFWRWHIARSTDRAIEVWTADDPEEYGPTIWFGYKR